MKDFNNLTTDLRLENWRNHRLLLDSASDTYIKDILSYWMETPYGSRTIDFYTPNTWPTPWDILYGKSLCKNTISLMIYYTIKMTSSINVRLAIIDDANDRYIVPLLDNNVILNYYMGSEADLENLDIKLIDIFSDTEISNKF